MILLLDNYDSFTFTLAEGRYVVLETVADVGLLVMKYASDVTSRVVPSEYRARTVSCCVAPVPSSTASGTSSRVRPWLGSRICP